MIGAFVFSFADISIIIEILRLNIRKIPEYIILIKYESYWVLHPNSRSKLAYAQFDPMQYQMSNFEEIKYFLLLCLMLPQLYHLISSTDWIDNINEDQIWTSNLSITFGFTIDDRYLAFELPRLFESTDRSFWNML